MKKLLTIFTKIKIQTAINITKSTKKIKQSKMNKNYQNQKSVCKIKEKLVTKSKNL